MSFYAGNNQTPETGLFSSVGNFFSNIFKPNNPTPNPTQPVLTQIPTAGGYAVQQNGATFGADLPSAYQVKPGDTDLAAVAGSLNVPLQQLVSANDGARTLPPVGSYMATGQAAPVGYGPYYQQQALGNQPVDLTRPGMGGANPNAYYQGAGAQTPQLPTMQQAQTMLRQGIDPPALHAGLVTALNLTHDQMVANGYTLDAATNTYKKAGAGTGAPATQQPNQEQARTQQQQIQSGVVPQGQQFQRVKASENYGAFVAQEQAFLNAQRWDPERKKYVSIRQLLNEGKLNVRDPQARFQWGQGGGGYGGGRGTPRRPITNTPAQQLSLMLGSG